MRKLAGWLGGIWSNLRWRPKGVLSVSSQLALRDGLVERGEAFGRTAEGSLGMRGLQGRERLVSLLDSLSLLLVVGGVFTGLGMVGMAEIEPKKVAYEQGKAIRATEQGEAVLRRGYLARREADSRYDPRAAVAAVRLPLHPAGPPPEGEILAVRANARVASFQTSSRRMALREKDSGGSQKAVGLIPILQRRG